MDTSHSNQPRQWRKLFGAAGAGEVGNGRHVSGEVFLYARGHSQRLLHQ